MIYGGNDMWCTGKCKHYWADGPKECPQCGGQLAKNRKDKQTKIQHINIYEWFLGGKKWTQQ